MEYPNLTALSKGRVEIQGSETWLRIRKEAKEALAEVERLRDRLQEADAALHYARQVLVHGYAAAQRR